MGSSTHKALFFKPFLRFRAGRKNQRKKARKSDMDFILFFRGLDHFQEAAWFRMVVFPVRRAKLLHVLTRTRNIESSRFGRFCRIYLQSVRYSFSSSFTNSSNPLPSSFMRQMRSVITNSFQSSIGVPSLI